MGLFDNFSYQNGNIVDKSWIKWYHFCVPDKEGPSREATRKWLKGLGHSSECTSLSGCYFIKNKTPKRELSESELLHPNCDCLMINIAKPKDEIVANCDLRKFTDYVFGKKYASNGKIKLLLSLGFEKEDSLYLKQQLDLQAKEKYLNGEYELGNLNEYGQRINITIQLSSKTKRNISLITGWLVHPLGKITCNTPLGG